MSEKKHTPGPWPIRKLDKRIIVGEELIEGAYDIAEVYADDCDPDEAAANAALIAAAPDMLAELETLHQIFDDYATIHWSKGHGDKADRNAAIAKRIDALIKKAST